MLRQKARLEDHDRFDEGIRRPFRAEASSLCIPIPWPGIRSENQLLDWVWATAQLPEASLPTDLPNPELTDL